MDWDERIGKRLTLRDLRILLTAIEAGSVSRAAAQLRVSQPAISKTITQIERALGAQLITRSSHGVQPTEQGRALAERGRAAFRELQAGAQAMADFSGPRTGELRLSGNQVALSGVIPAIIQRLHARHAGLVFHVVQSQTFGEQVRLLESGAAELIVGRVSLPMEAEHLNLIELFRDDFVVAAGPHHRWRRRKKIELQELLDEPWTFPPPETVTGHSMAEIFRTSGLDVPRLSVAASSLQLHQRLVMESKFLTFFPASLARSVPGLQILPVSLRLPAQSVGVLTLKFRTPSPLARLFIDEARNASPEFQRAAASR